MQLQQQQTENDLNSEEKQCTDEMKVGNVFYFAKEYDNGKEGSEEENKIPGRRKQEMIRRFGTPEQIKALDKFLGVESNKGAVIEEKTHVTQIKHEKREINHLKESLFFLQGAMKLKKKAKPEIITYDFARKIFWNYYLNVIKQESGISEKELVAILRRESDNTSYVIKNLVHWLIGSEEGEFNTGKSLFIWGDLGVGKSTIARTAFFLMQYFKGKHDWSTRYFNFVSMDELYLQIYSTQKLESVNKLSSGWWCLDELREKHCKYRHFGNELNFVGDLLMARHNLWKKNKDNTIITSNLSPKEVREVIADERLYDRIKQQYEIVELIGENKRHI